MTAIGVVNGPGGLAIGADSCVTRGPSRYLSDGKLVLSGPWAFAVAGAQEAAEWLRHHRPGQEHDEGAAEYVRRIGPLLRAWMSGCGQPGEPRGAAVLIAHCDGATWELDTVSGVPFLCHGCTGHGDSSAVEAAFRAARPWRQTNHEALRDALEACADVCPSVCHPIRVATWSTERGEWEVQP